LIIIASTNRPDLVDPSLLRPGRFDKMIYVGFPKNKEEKKKILVAQTKKFNLGNDVNFDELSILCPVDYSGADIYAVCSQAFTFSLKEYLIIEKQKNNNHITEDKNKFLFFDEEKKQKNFQNTIFFVNRSHFIKAIERISPSISKEELEKYEELKKKYS